MSNFNVRTLEFYGNPNLSYEDYGEIDTDRTGLSSGFVVFKCMAQRYARLQPIMGAKHPFAPFLWLTKRNVKFKEGIAFITCKYEGIELNYTPPPLYSLSTSCSEEPIETNPNFKAFAGTASNPLNGAVFVRIDNESITTIDGPKFDGDQLYRFKEFQTILSDSSLNPFAGILKYLDGTQLSWRVTNTVPLGSQNLGKLGTIQVPIGPIPTVMGADDEPRNWLYIGASSEQRGSAFQTMREWRLSGRRGWFDEIYDY